MKRVILCPNPYRDTGLSAAKEADAILRSTGLETVYCLPFRPDGGEGQYGVPFRPLHQELRSSDLIIAFGGDGTILHLARTASMRGIPLLGVNLGSLGFMSELELGELGLLKNLASGSYRRERRMMLDVSVLREGRVIYTGSALNDAVVTKGAMARVIRLQVTAGDDQLGLFSGDGVVVATPTGSTGYSLSAGGPIVEPTAQNFVISPICSHSVISKSFDVCRALRGGDGERGPGGAQPKAGLPLRGRGAGLRPAAGGPGVHLPLPVRDRTTAPDRQECLRGITHQNDRRHRP